MSKDNRNMKRNDGDIYYTLYNEPYVVRSQANCMAHVFDVILNKNPDRIQDALLHLKCLSETDYSTLNFIQDGKTAQSPYTYNFIPTGFRICKIFSVAGKKIYLGTSYSEKTKLRYITELILLCGESQEIFNYRTVPSQNALCVDSRYLKAITDSLLYYKLFNKEYRTNQSEFMQRVFEECFKRNIDSIDWALTNLDCLYEIEVNLRVVLKRKFIFTTQRRLHVNDRELILGTNLSLADKINRINLYLRAAGFDPDIYELLGRQNQNRMIKLTNRQQQAVEAVLTAAKNIKDTPELGYVFMVAGSGVITTILGTVQALQVEHPNRWSYLLVTDSIIEKERLVQALKQHKWNYHQIEKSLDLEKEAWIPDFITVTTIQKFLSEDNNSLSRKLLLKQVSYTIDNPVMVIFCNMRSLLFKNNMTALYSTFQKGTYLSFSSIPPEENVNGRFNRCLYRYSLEQAVNDGILLPVQIECKSVSIEEMPLQIPDMIKTLIDKQNVRKIMVLCTDIVTSEWYSRELAEKGVEAYSITTNLQKNMLNTAIERFYHAQKAVAFTVDFWNAIDRPELDMIIATRQLHSKTLLLHLAAKVARPSPGKEFGKLLLFGISEELLENWGIPEFFYRKMTNPIQENDGAVQFEALFAELRKNIGGGHWREAFYTLEHLKRLNIPISRLWENDLTFLFLPDRSLDENELYWRTYKEIVAQRAAIWYALTGEAQRDEENEISDDVDEPLLQEPDRSKQTVFTRSSGSQSQKIGDIFERNMKHLLEELLTTNGGEIEIVEFRRQCSGTQFGFDLRCKYLNTDGQLCNCLFECKNVAEIHMSDVTGKLAQASMSQFPVNHWVLVSPTARISNDLEIFLPRLERQVKEGQWEPVQNVQIWTPDQRVEELFGLTPEIYDHYYPNGTLRPQEWTSEQRESVVSRWRKKLQPGLMLPLSWQRYLYNPAKLLALQEEWGSYEEIYSNQVPVRCSSADGIPISGTAEEYIFDWLDRPTPKGQMPDTLFILGDFGDGKSFLTYSLSRRLVERFVEAPDRYHLPLRLLLSDLQQGVTPQDFLRLRLDQFGANLEQWRNLEEKYKILVILDGFDEMSSGMDLQTVEKNAVRLCSAIRFFASTKVIVTSRYPVFQSIKEKIISYFVNPSIIRLLPIGVKDKMDCLTAFARKNNCVERLQRLCATHDVIDLASKPLFLDMVKSILLNEEIEESDGISIYGSFSRATMERKVLFEREEMLTNREETLDAIWNILEEYALALTKNPDYGITMEEFLQDYKANGGESFARDIWKSLTEPTPCDEEDAENRLTSRTLLKPSSRGYVFCHRSLQEYYTARGMLRLLQDQPQQAQNYLMDTDISYETTYFLAAMLFRMDQIKAEKIKKILADMMTSTRNCAQNDYRTARLGAAALSIYYAAWKQVPEIDLRGLVLNNVVLAGADLSGRDFSGTSLRYANLDNVNITGSNLSFCDLTGVRLDETKELLAVRPADEGQPCLYALYGNGILRKWKNFRSPQCAVISINEQYTGIAVSYGRMTLYSSRQLCFGAIQEKRIVPQGGIHDLENIYIYDMNDKRLLYKQAGFLTLYDLKACNVIFNNYPIEDYTEAILFDENRVLVYRSQNSAGIVSQNEENSWSFTPVRLQDEESLRTAAAVQMTNETYLLCCGHSNKMIRLYSVICGSVMETRLLNEINMECAIRDVVFLSSKMLVCAGQNGILYLFNVTNDNSLCEIAQFKSKILCKDCIVDGLEPQKHRERLLSYGAKSSC